jgi:hypothetical protein
MFSYILQLICLSACFFNINAIYIKMYMYIIDASGTLRSRGFFENDTPDTLLPKNAPASLCALATLVGRTYISKGHILGGRAHLVQVKAWLVGHHCVKQRAHC